MKTRGMKITIYTKKSMKWSFFFLFLLPCVVFRFVVIVQTVSTMIWSWPITSYFTAFCIAGTCNKNRTQRDRGIKTQHFIAECNYSVSLRWGLHLAHVARFATCTVSSRLSSGWQKLQAVQSLCTRNNTGTCGTRHTETQPEPKTLRFSCT